MVKKEQYTFVAEKGEVKVNTNVLYIREGKPDYEGVPKTGEVKKDEFLRYIGYVTDGKNFEGNRKWYLDPSGNFFWSGGVTEIKTRKDASEPLPTFIWPIKKTYQRISQSFGEVWSANTNKQHTGTDIPVPPGEPVYACASGTVMKVGNLDAHGKWAQYIIVKHDSDNYCSAYLHVDPKSNISTGKKVKAKQVIATIADIGANHLHFNLWRGTYKTITARGALPLPENKGKINPKTDPAFPDNFVNAMSFNYDYIE